MFADNLGDKQKDLQTKHRICFVKRTFEERKQIPINDSPEQFYMNKDQADLA